MERQERKGRMAAEMSRTVAQNSVRISRSRGVRREEEKLNSYRYKIESTGRQKKDRDYDMSSTASFEESGRYGKEGHLNTRAQATLQDKMRSFTGHSRKATNFKSFIFLVLVIIVILVVRHFALGA